MVLKAFHHQLQLPTHTPQALSLHPPTSSCTWHCSPCQTTVPSIRGPLCLEALASSPLCLRNPSLFRAHHKCPLTSFLESPDRINGTIHFLTIINGASMLIFRDRKMNKTNGHSLLRTEMLSDKLPYIVDTSTKKLYH